jgi:DNA-binding XRE family transcriptional regulator
MIVQTQEPCRHCCGCGKEPNQSETGRAIAALREAANMNAKDMAHAIGVSAGYYCDLEHGRRAWNSELIGKVAHALSTRT